MPDNRQNNQNVWNATDCCQQAQRSTKLYALEEVLTAVASTYKTETAA